MFSGDRVYALEAVVKENQLKLTQVWPRGSKEAETRVVVLPRVFSTADANVWVIPDTDLMLVRARDEQNQRTWRQVFIYDMKTQTLVGSSSGDIQFYGFNVWVDKTKVIVEARDSERRLTKHFWALDLASLKWTTLSL